MDNDGKPHRSGTLFIPGTPIQHDAELQVSTKLSHPVTPPRPRAGEALAAQGKRHRLNASVRPAGETWEAADITHNGPPGGPVPVLHTNGPVSPLHMRRFQAFKRYCSRPQGGFHPRKDDLRQRYSRVTHATFTQIWTQAQRARFSTKAKQAGF